MRDNLKFVLQVYLDVVLEPTIDNADSLAYKKTRYGGMHGEQPLHARVSESTTMEASVEKSQQTVK